MHEFDHTLSGSVSFQIIEKLFTSFYQWSNNLAKLCSLTTLSLSLNMCIFFVYIYVLRDLESCLALITTTGYLICSNWYSFYCKPNCGNNNRHKFWLHAHKKAFPVDSFLVCFWTAGCVCIFRHTEVHWELWSKSEGITSTGECWEMWKEERWHTNIQTQDCE